MPKRKNTEQQDNVEMFIKALGKPFSLSYSDMSPEQEALELERAKKAVTELLDNDFTINTNITTRIIKRSNKDKTISGTALHLAALYLRKYFLQVLIEKGADVNATNDEGLTPIQILILNPFRNWTIHCLTLLVKHGAKLDVVDNKGRTLLDLCVIAKNNSKETVDYLIKHKVTYSEKHEPDILQIASENTMTRNYNALVKKISPEKLNSTDENGRTFLHHIAYYGRNVDSLLEAGATVDCIDNFDRLPLHYALLTGNNKNIKKLYKHSTWSEQQHIDFVDKSGNNLLHFLLIGVVIKYFISKSKKNPNTLFKQLSVYLEIFGNPETILENIVEENNSSLTPLDYYEHFIKKKSLPENFNFPKENRPVQDFFSWDRRCDYTSDPVINNFILNFHESISNPDSREQIQIEILKRICDQHPNVIEDFILPRPSIHRMMLNRNITSVYLADKIYQNITEMLPVDLHNALIFQTSIIKKMSKSELGRPKINYPSEIVYELFKNTRYFLFKDLAALISTFLDFYTLNNVLPLVRKSCAQVSQAIIDSKNSIQITNTEGKYVDLDGPATNTFLWNTFVKNSYPSDTEDEQWKDKAFEIAALYLQCRGVDPSYTQDYFKTRYSQSSKRVILSLLDFKKKKALYAHIVKKFNSKDVKESKEILDEECMRRNVCQDLSPGFTLFPLEEFGTVENDLATRPDFFSDDNDEAVTPFVLDKDQNYSFAHLFSQSWNNSPIHASTPPLTHIDNIPDNDDIDDFVQKLLN